MEPWNMRLTKEYPCKIKDLFKLVNVIHHANPIPPGHLSKGGENDVEAPGNLKFCYFYCFGHLSKFKPAIRKSLNGKAESRETLNKHISVDVYISLLSSPGTQSLYYWRCDIKSVLLYRKYADICYLIR